MKKKASDFLELLGKYFESYLPCSVGASMNTISSYKYAFRLLIEYMYAEKDISADKISFASLDYDTLLSFFSWLETKRGCCPSTKNQRLSALSSFSEYAQNPNFEAAAIFRNNVKKIPSKRTRHKLRAIFTLEEVTVLLGMPRGNIATEIRDKTLLSTMYASGARAQEVCDLMVGNIQFNKDTASLILNGKGGKCRRIGIPKECSALLKKYIHYREISNQRERYVFSSQTHEHMTVSCIEGIFKKYVGLAREAHQNLFREKSYPPHAMRHSTATHMLEAGVPLAVIKNFLGHTSLQSTQIYAEVTQNTLNKHIKIWNDKWQLPAEDTAALPERSSKIPDFLKNSVS
jgi:site-specific recombinase XerD